MKTVDLLVLNAAQVVTVAAGAPGPARGRAAMNDLGVVENASIAVHRGKVVSVGPTNEVILECRAERRLFADGCAVLPGFVDAHTHPAFARWREDEFARRCRGETYEEILAAGGGILASADALRAAPEADLVASMRATFDAMLLCGTTVVEAKSGYGLSAEAEIKSLRAIRRAGRGQPITVVPTFLGAHAVPREYASRRAAWVRLLTHTLIPKVVEEGLAEFCDVFCERGAFSVEVSEAILRAARRHGLAAKIHADEMTDGGGAALAAKVGATSAEHLGATSSDGIRAMAKAGVVPVLLPSTSLFLRLPRLPDARAMIDAGCAVSLASDFNPGSSPTHDLGLVAALACATLSMTPEEAITAITRNAAAAVNRVDRAGQIAPGRRADLVILDAPSYVHLPYRMGSRLVRDVIRGGRVVVREGRRVPEGRRMPEGRRVDEKPSAKAETPAGKAPRT
jgi:imidazolonepropionase